MRVDCARVASESVTNMGFFCLFSSRTPAILEGLSGVIQGVFSTTLPMPVKWRQNGERGRNRPVFSGNCQENLGSYELVTKCNHLVDFNKVAISCEKLFLIRANSPDLKLTNTP